MELIVNRDGKLPDPTILQGIKQHVVPEKEIIITLDVATLQEILANHFWKDSAWILKNYSRCRLTTLSPNITLHFTK